MTSNSLSTRPTRSLRTIAALILLALPAQAAPPPKKIAFTNATILPVVGEKLSGATLLVENGVIKAIGKDVKLPYDAMEIDASGKVLFPGLVDAHSARGLDVANESLPVTPFVDVVDALDPSRSFFEQSLRNGVTSIHVIPGNSCVVGGVSRVVHPIGRTPEEMTQLADFALKLSTTPKSGFDRMLQLVTLRQTFAELAAAVERAAEKRYEDQLEKQGKELDVAPDEAIKRGRELLEHRDIDDKHRNLARLVDGKLGAFIACREAMDVGPAVAIAKQHGFLERSVLVVGASTHHAVRELAAAGRPVIIGPDLVERRRDPITGELTETFAPAVLHEAGISFALLPSPSSSLAERFLTYQAARCVRHGIPRQVALESITIRPARMIGVGDRLGSLEVGKTANVLVLSGDPLDFSTVVEHVFIKGVHAYDRSRDPRLESLLPESLGAEPTGSKPASPGNESENESDEKSDGKRGKA